MRLDVHKALNEPGVSVPFEMTEELPSFEFSGESYTARTPLHISGTVLSMKDRIALEARLTVSLTGHCARCLEPVPVAIEVVMEETFDRDPPDDEPDWFAYSGTALDLADAAKAAVIHALPMRLLCDASCEGLCPTCGAKRSEGCPCPKDGAVSPHFAGLANWRPEDSQ